jgi:quinoprotein glucose dehydrogenase
LVGGNETLWAFYFSDDQNVSRLGGGLASLLPDAIQIPRSLQNQPVACDDDRQIAGILKSEDAKELKLITPEGKPITIEKSLIDERTTGKSAMPQDIAKPLSKSDLRDLVEFLSGLKK